MANDALTYAQPKKKGFWDSMGLVPKFLIAIGTIIIATMIIFGLDLGNLPQFFVNMVGVGIGMLLILFALQGIASRLQPKPFSPTESFYTKLIKISLRTKPPNVYNLWLRGEERRSRALYGKIIGLSWIPYLTSRVVRDDEGKVVHLEDENGKPLLNSKNEPIPRREVITSKDGDTIFVVKKGLLGVPEMIRCNSRHHSELIGDIYIKDLSLVPMGEYFYPSKQWQDDIIQIQKQNEIETILTTFMNNLDLVSNVTTISIASSPEFQKILSLRNEVIGSPMAMGMQQGRV